jgi:hypothetical protein
MRSRGAPALDRLRHWMFSAAMNWFTHEFKAPIERHGVGRARRVWYNVVFLPAAMVADLPFARHPQLRIDGEIADVPVKSAFIPAGQGRYYVIVSPETMKSATLELGQTVEVRFRVSDQDAVDIPDGLARAIEGGAPARHWAALTPGRRRGLAHFVATARTETTRRRRVAAVLAAIAGEAGSGEVAADVVRLGRLLG